ncbi:GGDEF domain-containing protein [Frankia sp. AgB1.9]|uniref:GGDEF domain-containing protein n=1 Tax=unclassified Frankia TaxID=2632575 RepID=UPI0019343A81|nr:MULTISPECIES: GGDEF domain-containing protein [unclassified Frankia]MBL7488164.1 GGDEF domain-containing protein [Frankia sp. AgW1.1]MBL7553218.1 GGDEF domain-containing protein [Frankia sp. AgB1.9]MBL7620167.1 GGDEF domain-containing protein [Frankia sp. AgB1.8]
MLGVAGTSRPDGCDLDTVAASPRRLRIAVCCAVPLVALVTLAAGLSGGRAQTYVIGMSQTLALTFTATVAAWFGSRAHGAGRRWRLCLATGALVTAACSGLVFYRTAAGADIAASGLSAGIMSMVATVFFVGALVTLPTERSDAISARLYGVGRPSHLVLVLDGLLISGSIFLLLWSTTLRAALSAHGSQRAEAASSILETVCGLVMLSVVLMIAEFRRPVNHRALALTFLGLIAYQLSDAALIYHALTGQVAYTTLVTFTTITGSLLLALAVCVPHGPSTGRGRFGRRERARMWSQILLPYVPLTAVTVLTAVRVIEQYPFGFIEIGVGVGLVFLVTARQLVTIVQNVRLLTAFDERGRLLHHQANHDALTGLANRKLFLERLAVAGRRHGERMALLFCDLDGFKRVNDVYGHKAGDAVLRVTSARLLGCIREQDVAARLGGDEFAVLLGDAGREEAGQAAGRIVGAMRRPVHVESTDYLIGISVGVAVMDTDGSTDVEALVHRADAAMYRAKRAGKSCFAIAGADVACATLS